MTDNVRDVKQMSHWEWLKFQVNEPGELKEYEWREKANELIEEVERMRELIAEVKGVKIRPMNRATLEAYESSNSILRDQRDKLLKEIQSVKAVCDKRALRIVELQEET